MALYIPSRIEFREGNAISKIVTVRALASGVSPLHKLNRFNCSEVTLKVYKRVLLRASCCRQKQKKRTIRRKIFGNAKFFDFEKTLFSVLYSFVCGSRSRNKIFHTTNFYSFFFRFRERAFAKRNCISINRIRIYN